VRELTLCALVAVTVRYSHYWPPLLGVNCGRAQDGVCVSRTASGDRWQDWVGRGIACPPSWPFGSEVYAFGSWWTCVDRGRMVQYVGGVPYLDFLVSQPHLGHGTLVQVEVRWGSCPKQHDSMSPSWMGGHRNIVIR